MTTWTDWITNIYNTNTRRNRSIWFWTTITPKTTVYPDIPWNQRNVSDARWNDDQFVQVAARRTALLSKIAIHDTLAKIDPTFSPNNPQRTRGDARVAVLLVPALAKRVSAKSSQMIRVIHFHGWIILNPKPIRSATLTTTERTRQVAIHSHDIQTRVWLPEPVGLLVETLADAFGPNLNISPTPDTDELLMKHAEYATRNTMFETTHPEHVVRQPGWFWKIRLREVA